MELFLPSMLGMARLGAGHEARKIRRHPQIF